MATPGIEKGNLAYTVVVTYGRHSVLLIQERTAGHSDDTVPGCVPFLCDWDGKAKDDASGETSPTVIGRPNSEMAKGSIEPRYSIQPWRFGERPIPPAARVWPPVFRNRPPSCRDSMSR